MTDKIADELRWAINRGMEGAGTLPAKEAVKVRPSDWHAIIDIASAAIDALEAKDKRIAELEAALRDVRGYVADVAVAGMLIGADQNETHTRVSAHGIAMLKIVDATLRALSQEQSNA